MSCCMSQFNHNSTNEFCQLHKKNLIKRSFSRWCFCPFGGMVYQPAATVHHSSLVLKWDLADGLWTWETGWGSRAPPHHPPPPPLSGGGDGGGTDSSAVAACGLSYRWSLVIVISNYTEMGFAAVSHTPWHLNTPPASLFPIRHDKKVKA